MSTVNIDLNCITTNYIVYNYETQMLILSVNLNTTNTGWGWLNVIKANKDISQD